MHVAARLQLAGVRQIQVVSGDRRDEGDDFLDRLARVDQNVGVTALVTASRQRKTAKPGKQKCSERDEVRQVGRTAHSVSSTPSHVEDHRRNGHVACVLCDHFYDGHVPTSTMGTAGDWLDALGCQ